MSDQYIVSARKYRPATFHSVVGQKALTATLKNAIGSGRLAQAYLFTGPRGVGKTSCARIFAKTINCLNRTPEGEACGECASCRSIDEGNSFNIIELDAASNNSVNDIRDITDQVNVPPQVGKYRVFIIDEVHMLSSSAFNAFLKTLEEPPSYVIFILATTEKQKVLPTILSRCQIYDFKRITVGDMIDHLQYVASQEGIEAEPEALGVIARKADGAMRDALSIFDQVAASCRGNITYAGAVASLNVLDASYYSRLLDAFLQQDVPTALLIYQEIRQRGFDSQFFINGLADYMRDLMVARDPRTIALLDTDTETAQKMSADAAKFAPEFFYKAMSLCNSADLSYRTATNKTFLVELLLIRLCQLLSPSPIFDDGDGEGQLQPLVADTRFQGASAPAAAQAPQGAAHAPVSPASPTAATTHSPASQSPAPAAAARPPQPAATAAPRPGTPFTGRVSLHGRGRPVHSLADVDKIDLGRPTPGAQTSASAAGAPGAAPQRAEAYTRDDLLAQWRAYCDARPTQHLLINTMRTALPMAVADTEHRYELVVENPVQESLLNDEMPSLLRHLRNTLRNDAITLHVTVNEGAGAVRTWSDREIFKQLLETNPHLADLTRTLRLSLE